jgi:uncharacterized membrane protein YkvA (DUF1232 family)
MRWKLGAAARRENREARHEMKIDAESELGKRTKKMTRDDIADVLGKEGKAKTIVDKAGFLSQYWDDIKTSFALIRDWFKGSYDKVPARMIVSLAGALIYLVSPLDLIPDWVPMAGLVDDAAMLAFVFQLSKVDLNAYRKWKRSQQADEDDDPDIDMQDKESRR